MKERPILFSAPMVRALLDGSKTQTRRTVKLPHQNPLGVWEPFAWGGPNGGRTKDGATVPEQMTIAHSRTGEIVGCPYGQPGDRLWVRETWHPSAIGSHPNWSSRYVLYAADNEGLGPMDGCCLGKELSPPVEWTGTQKMGWHPSIHMHRWASRITLEITGVRVERLQDISEADVIEEGCPREILYGTGWYRQLWESINGLASWDANPWVWAVEFKKVTA
jgi:hypothetical protein